MKIIIRPMEIINIIDKLPKKGLFSIRPIEGITHLVIHHSASPAGVYTPYHFAQWHMDGKMKAPGICYHYSIDPTGAIYKCQEHKFRVWHASDANTYSIGIELDGNFMKEKPTVHQMNSLRWLIRELEKELLKTLVLVGHQEVDSTLCPGINMMAIKNEWRSLNK